MSIFTQNNKHVTKRSCPGWRMLQDVSSIYLWSCTSAFFAIEPSAAVSQGKLTSLLIALLVITECSCVKPGRYFKLTSVQTARSRNAPRRISWRLLLYRTRYLQPTGGPSGSTPCAIIRELGSVQHLLARDWTLACMAIRSDPYDFSRAMWKTVVTREICPPHRCHSVYNLREKIDGSCARMTSSLWCTGSVL